MSKARIIFFGSPGFAVPALTALSERPDLCEVVAVVTQPDKPAGRGQKLTPCAVKVAAEARRLPALSPTKLKIDETHDTLAAFAPDLAVVAAYGRILPPRLLALPRLGCINIHASLLPRHRGASPISAAILAGDPQAGVAIMQMDEGLDTGGVHAMRGIPIAADDTTATLTVKLATLGATLLIDTLPSILNGTSKAAPQPSEGVTYAPLLDKADGELVWTAPAVELERRVRAMTPWPGASFGSGEQRTVVLRATVIADTSGTPGEVLRADGQGLVVACGQGALRLDEVKPAGRKAMSGAAFVAGRGAARGDQLGKSLPT